MKDYELMASKAGLSIYRSMYDEQGIKKYKINRKSNHVEITYMNGATTYNELTETSKEDLDEKQKLYFEKLKYISESLAEIIASLWPVECVLMCRTAS